MLMNGIKGLSDFDLIINVSDGYPGIQEWVSFNYPAGNNELPIIVSMRGTNSESGFEILKNSNLNLYVANNLGTVSKLLLELEKQNDNFIR